MLRVDIRDLDRGPVETDARLEPTDPIFEGLGLALAGPVDVSGRLQATSDGEYLWRGRIQAAVDTECRRCLTAVRQEIDAGADVLFSSDPDAADDPSVYALPETAAAVDVGEAVREELALAAQPYVLCREDCAGLCPRCGADLNAGACRCAASAEPV
jgi:uncharacterized protein